MSVRARAALFGGATAGAGGGVGTSDSLNATMTTTDRYGYGGPSSSQAPRMEVSRAPSLKRPLRPPPIKIISADGTTEQQPQQRGPPSIQSGQSSSIDTTTSSTSSSATSNFQSKIPTARKPVPPYDAFSPVAPQAALESPPPPLPPVKPYPPKLAANPPSPFSLSFKLDKSASTTPTIPDTAASSTTRPGLSSIESSKANMSSTSTRARVARGVASNDSSMDDRYGAAGASRDSLMSTASSNHLSAVVQTASAMSFERALATAEPLPHLANMSRTAGASSSSSSSKGRPSASDSSDVEQIRSGIPSSTRYAVAAADRAAKSSASSSGTATEWVKPTRSMTEKTSSSSRAVANERSVTPQSSVAGSTRGSVIGYAQASTTTSRNNFASETEYDGAGSSSRRAGQSATTTPSEEERRLARRSQRSSATGSTRTSRTGRYAESPGGPSTSNYSGAASSVRSASRSKSGLPKRESATQTATTSTGRRDGTMREVSKSRRGSGMAASVANSSPTMGEVTPRMGSSSDGPFRRVTASPGDGRVAASPRDARVATSPSDSASTAAVPTPKSPSSSLRRSLASRAANTSTSVAATSIPAPAPVSDPGNLTSDREAWGTSLVSSSDVDTFESDQKLRGMPLDSAVRSLWSAASATSDVASTAPTTAEPGSSSINGKATFTSPDMLSPAMQTDPRDMAPLTKDDLISSLFTSLALVDAAHYEPILSLEEVETLKRELSRLEKRAGELRLSLKVAVRVREAASKLMKVSRVTAGRRDSVGTSSSYQGGIGNMSGSGSVNGGLAAPGSGGQGPLSPMSSIAPATPSTASSSNYFPMTSETGKAASKAESEVSDATLKVDRLSAELLQVSQQAEGIRRRLLEHTASILRGRISSLEQQLSSARIMTTATPTTQAAAPETRTRVPEGLLEEMEEAREAADKARRDAHGLRKTIEETKTQLARALGEAQAAQDRHERESSRLQAEVDRARQDIGSRSRELEAARALHETASQQAAQHAEELAKLRQEVERERHLKEEAQRQLQEGAKLLQAQESSAQETSARLKQLELEMIAERKIMHDRTQLFTAFERRLESAETRLRKQDARCARILGKDEGREEMDDLLAQIKQGYGAVKKEKTAGQDIDDLLHSLEAHVEDLADEIARGSGGRRGLGITGCSDMDEEEEEEDDVSDDAKTGQAQATLVQLREMELELQAAEREAERWRSEAESAQRQLAAASRLSAISGAGSTLSDRRLTVGERKLHAELEARIAALERRNTALADQLAEARMQASGIVDGHHSASGPASPIKVAGSEGGGSDDVGAGGNSTMTTTNGRTATQTLEQCRGIVSTLMEILPEVELASIVECASSPRPDLGTLRSAFENPLPPTPAEAGVVELARSGGKFKAEELDMARSLGEVAERVRATLAAGRAALAQASSLEMARRGLEADVASSEDRCRSLMQAVEELRNEHASQTQSAEAAMAKQRKLEATVIELQQALDEAKASSQATSVSRSSSNRSGHGRSVGEGSGSRQILPSALTLKSGAANLGGSRPPVMRSMTLSTGTSTMRERAGGSSPVPPLVIGSIGRSRGGSSPAAGQPAIRAGGGPSGSNKATAASTSGVVPRTITLGMDARQLVSKVKDLERELDKVQGLRKQAQKAVELESQLEEARNELLNAQTQLDEIKGAESRQRIQLLDELNMLQSELASARANLRAEQRRKGTMAS